MVLPPTLELNRFKSEDQEIVQEAREDVDRYKCCLERTVVGNIDYIDVCVQGRVPVIGEQGGGAHSVEYVGVLDG